jgi:hypothetical protein
MTDLPPAAHAVLDAWESEWSKGSLCHDQRSLAAALRAAADQVVPYDDLKGSDPDAWTRDDIRRELLAIAAELETI